MESKPQASTLGSIFLLLLLGFARSDVNQDKAECSNQLMGLAPCIPYVDGEAKAPTIDCCSGLKQVVDKSRKCLCVLIKDGDDPSLGLKINATLAAALPSSCRATVNMTDCISLLHLAPNSREAKLFEGYQKLTEGHPRIASTTPSTTTGNSTSSGAEKSDGGKGKKWAGIQFAKALGVSLWIFTLHQNLAA
ncbi:glycosylphosphatidylinositol-anchored lipid protein transfer 6 [Hibiscus trionum]|uniref:Glycosylphosphatidylinositol-anchored lipid protein transfer 6 n=1 Tax=Hibiscus trionum TaxID=183268 RepID=A0A9W7MHP4_HIBTR|nr:glycosylphosphatidylinositol-anchored lipid protein transfer 6 [Hibiscus trionum]